MRQRALIAMAISCGPRVLLADEPTSALDKTLEREIVELVRDLRRETRMAVLWITHDLRVAAACADRVLVVYAGRVVEETSADELFARLIAIGGRHPLVELAFGDRFTIAHQRGIIGQQTKLWRAYLGKFPHGRFADDARAGLCRHAAAKDEASCWTDYLADFPKGAYRGLAARSVAESPEP